MKYIMKDFPLKTHTNVYTKLVKIYISPKILLEYQRWKKLDIRASVGCVSAQIVSASSRGDSPGDVSKINEGTASVGGKGGAGNGR